jgi:hypothetical protein
MAGSRGWEKVRDGAGSNDHAQRPSYSQVASGGSRSTSPVKESDVPAKSIKTMILKNKVKQPVSTSVSRTLASIADDLDEITTGSSAKSRSSNLVKGAKQTSSGSGEGSTASAHGSSRGRTNFSQSSPAKSGSPNLASNDNQAASSFDEALTNTAHGGSYGYSGQTRLPRVKVSLVSLVNPTGDPTNIFSEGG